MENYCVRRDYTPRPMPDYFDDMVTEDSGVIYQPDVYLRARDIADRLGAWTLIDVGAGSGVKLADISNGRHVIALDYGANLQRGIRRYPQFSWRQYDVEADDALPVEPV